MVSERGHADAAASPRVELLQVGLGGWGRSWATELLRAPELVRPLGYVDVVPAMLQSLRAETGVAEDRCFTDLAEAVRTTGAGTVLVTTALPHHADVAITALELGCHVIVEKPIAPTIADAEAMVLAAQRAGRTLMVSQNYRRYPAVREAARLIGEGELGAVGSVSVSFRQYANEAPREGWGHYALPDPLLMDMSIHHFDLMRDLLGREPLSIAAESWNPPWSRFDGDAAARALLSFEGGISVAYEGSWVSSGAPTLWAGEWVVECEDGVLRFTSRANTTTSLDRLSVTRRGRAEEVRELPGIRYFDRLGTVAEFASAREAGRRPDTDGRDNIASLAIALAAIDSAATSRRIPLPAR